MSKIGYGIGSPMGLVLRFAPMPTAEPRKELLLRLAAAGREAIERKERERHAAVEATTGALTGLYRLDELERLREDWPA